MDTRTDVISFLSCYPLGRKIDKFFMLPLFIYVLYVVFFCSINKSVAYKKTYRRVIASQGTGISPQQIHETKDPSLKLLIERLNIVQFNHMCVVSLIYNRHIGLTD